MEQNNTDEINLSHVYASFKKNIKRSVVLLFKAIDFLIRNWIVIAGIIVLGVALGYFSQINTTQSKKATVLLRVNFDAVNYLYSEVDLINEKLKEKDSLFFSVIGLNTDSLEINKMKLTPLVNIKDIIEKYDGKARNLDGLLKNVEFDEGETVVSETFTTEYIYHSLEFSLKPNADEETINKVINYFNSDEFLQQTKDVKIKNIEDRLISNNIIISQIDTIINQYQQDQPLQSFTDQIYVVDKNFSIHGLFNKKTELVHENEVLREFLIVSKDIIVMVNKPSLIKIKPGVTSNKIIFYPLSFVFAFLLLAFMRHSFWYLKEIAKTEENK